MAKYTSDQLEMYCNFEIPKTTSEDARRVLDRLNRCDVVVFRHDDGQGDVVRVELLAICGEIGLTCLQEPYMLVIFTEEGEKKFGVQC